MNKKKKVVNVNRHVFSTTIMDLLKLRIVVDSHNSERVPVDKNKIKTRTNKKELKKVYKNNRHQ